jgi:hypothetical protein
MRSQIAWLPPDVGARLEPWLHQALKGVAVVPSLDGHWWCVEVNNGLEGHAGDGTVVARCRTHQDGELVAAGLWALVARNGRQRPQESDEEFLLRTLSKHQWEAVARVLEADRR